MMRPLALTLVLALALLGPAVARADAWPGAPGHAQLPIWPDAIPDATPASAKPESVGPAEHPVGGKPWIAVYRVAQPTMSVFPARGKNTGAAVVVFPGGGYQILAIDLEGTEVCEWFAERGITAVLLKYRVPDSGPHWDRACKCHKDPVAPTALEDAQRTLGLVRQHAAEWNVDPHKVGVVGFSAGGHLVADVSTHWTKRAYRTVDAADTQSCRPDFAVAVYPGHMREHTTKEYDLNSRLPVNASTPPTLLIHSVEDPVDPVENSVVYYLALEKAHVPVEIHLYAHGGHAFGLRETKFAITRWPELVMTWMRTIGVLAQ